MIVRWKLVESQIKRNNERKELLKILKRVLPKITTSEDELLNSIYQDGALSIKVKRLIALAIGLRAGCANCILAQTMRALEAGATTDEILETISVEIAMSGTTGIAESLRVIKLLDELGRIKK